MVRPNSYQKKAAPTFGARIATGDPDYNNLSIWQHWVQKCWIGGMGADDWIDDAMFKEGLGVDITKHERVTLSRELKPAGTNFTLGGWDNGQVNYRQFKVFQNVLYCLVSRDSPDDTGDSRLYWLNTATSTWTLITMPGSSFHARAIVVFDHRLLVGGVQTAGTDVAKLYQSNIPASKVPVSSWTAVVNPAGVTTYGVTAMQQYNSKLYVSYGNSVWRMIDGDDPADAAKTWEGTRFYVTSANSASNYIRAYETHLGFLYMLSSNGHLHRTDGNNTFDIWSWDGQTKGVSLRSFDGKLYVGTYEWEDTAEVGYGVLYQFTGAAVTELKRWGRYGQSTTIGNMMVYGRRLYYGASSLYGLRNGFGVAVYDPIEDAHSIFAVQDSGTYGDTSGTGAMWQVDDVIIFGGKLYASVRGHGVFMTEDSFQDGELGRAQYCTSTNGGYIVSSLYDAGTPGLQKLWRKVTVYMNLPHASTSFLASYSTDGGATWTFFANQTGPSPASNMYTFYLNNVRSGTFKWKIILKTTNEAYTPTLKGIVVAYLPQPEPNWMWSFSIPVADYWELLDGTKRSVDTNALMASLDTLYRSQSLVSFTDIDSSVWATTGPGVLIYDMTVVHYDIESPREGDIRITLLETVESY